MAGPRRDQRQEEPRPPPRPHGPGARLEARPGPRLGHQGRHFRRGKGKNRQRLHDPRDEYTGQFEILSYDRNSTSERDMVSTLSDGLMGGKSIRDGGDYDYTFSCCPHYPRKVTSSTGKIQAAIRHFWHLQECDCDCLDAAAPLGRTPFSTLSPPTRETP